MPVKSDNEQPEQIGDESFLSRWSRRKQQARGVPEGTADPAAAPKPDAAKPARPEPAPIDPATLPRIEDLTAGSDFSVFMQKGVPEHLKRLALRRAWSLDPAIRDFIEVAENQYDWNAPDGVPGFGPIAPGTDVAAMARQILGGIAGQAPDPSTGEPETTSATLVEGEVGAGDIATTHERGDAAGTGEHVVADQDKDPSLYAAKTDAPRAEDEIVAADQGNMEAVTTEHVEAAPGPVRRRHGGALPA